MYLIIPKVTSLWWLNYKSTWSDLSLIRRQEYNLSTYQWVIVDIAQKSDSWNVVGGRYYQWCSRWMEAKVTILVDNFEKYGEVIKNKNTWKKL